MQENVTQILQEWSAGDTGAAERLMPLVYAELRRMAGRYLSGERSDHTLQATALVHEAYLRLADQTRVTWQNRGQFFGVAAQAMRRILIDHARSRATERRGGTAQRFSLDESLAIPLMEPEQSAADMLALDEALSELGRIDPRKSQVVELRFFGGLGEEEIATFLSISKRTVIRDWQMARLWLYRELAALDATGAAREEPSAE
jgi:RNA polymerase sigma factor (TIGR02999 family)